MNILNEILNAQNGRVVEQMAGQFGLQQDDVRNAVASMLPALTEGLKKNVSSSQQGADDLLSALTGQRHTQYIDRPETLSNRDTVNDGNSILGHILGTKERSRTVAGKASNTTGIDPATLKGMLPVLATVVMGAMSKKTPRGAGNKDLDALASFIDLDGDGSVADDLLDFARKLF